MIFAYHFVLLCAFLWQLTGGRSGRWAGGFHDVLVVPRQIPLHTIALVTRSLDAVVLVWIDDELSVDSQRTHRLVHLLASLDRHVEISLTAHEQSRSLNPVCV